ncbi:DUF262 domain-containing protein [Pontibacter silvestris]|uniref:DUF262 domain-containing protein n=1 Tax=Pontibacter silvestris TaxID=2305183 RepID=A0ABW4X233_9BACT|nr:DUF262 domain-containing protein [Pontibacter silvestris]MCC9134982.1 DUF262 domain-containing protein [Pontibacter silvestris]
MKYFTTEWTIEELIEKHQQKKLVLSPPYQRNFIWSKKDQDDLIRSILLGYPLPNLFMYEISTDKLEVVDGQQRIRTILGYFGSNYFSKQLNAEEQEQEKAFYKYKLTVTIISDISEHESIEDFYAKVNKTGLKMNKPELNKAEFYETKYLSLNEELASNSTFKGLNLFTETASNRMNDVDLVSELTAYLLKNELYDKKDAVDHYYEKDITEEQYNTTKEKFAETIKIIASFNDICKLNKTRFRQRNDFFTLFNFIHENRTLSLEAFTYLYSVLLELAPKVSPSASTCPPLREYARNCVTQSNSKDARKNRLRIVSEILLGDNGDISKTQKDIIDFFELTKNSVVNKYDLCVFDIDKLKVINEQ